MTDDPDPLAACRGIANGLAIMAAGGLVFAVLIVWGARLWSWVMS